MSSQVKSSGRVICMPAAEQRSNGRPYPGLSAVRGPGAACRMPSAAERKVAVGMTVRAKFALGCRGSGSRKGAWLEARVVRVYRDGSVRVRYVDERLGAWSVFCRNIGKCRKADRSGPYNINTAPC